MSELWAIHIRANQIMGLWVGEIVYVEPDHEGCSIYRRIAGFSGEMPEAGGVIADALAVIECAHVAITDAANPGT